MVSGTAGSRCSNSVICHRLGSSTKEPKTKPCVLVVYLGAALEREGGRPKQKMPEQVAWHYGKLELKLWDLQEILPGHLRTVLPRDRRGKHGFVGSVLQASSVAHGCGLLPHRWLARASAEQLSQVSHQREASGEKVNSLRPQGSPRVAHSVRSCLHEPGRSLCEIDLGSSGVRAEAKRIGSGSDRGLPHHQCVSISVSLCRLLAVCICVILRQAYPHGDKMHPPEKRQAVMVLRVHHCRERERPSPPSA